MGHSVRVEVRVRVHRRRQNKLGLHSRQQVGVRVSTSRQVRVCSIRSGRSTAARGAQFTQKVVRMRNKPEVPPKTGALFCLVRWIPILLASFSEMLFIDATHKLTNLRMPLYVFLVKEKEEQEDVVAAAEDSTDAQSEEDSTPWHLFGTVCPKEEILFLCQVLVLFTVILISIYNLTTSHENSNLWTALLSSSLGYLLPNPTLRRNGD